MHPLETRDVAAASIIRECTDRNKGVDTGSGKAVWLDTPMIERIGGEGTIEARIPAMLRMFMNHGIDIRREPILVFPTLHYQNGGLDINVDGMTPNVPNLYVAGEAVGGIHGRNRLMGNSLLDIIVFGRSAGRNAAHRAAETVPAKLTLNHVAEFESQLNAAGIETEAVSRNCFPITAENNAVLLNTKSCGGRRITSAVNMNITSASRKERGKLCWIFWRQQQYFVLVFHGRYRFANPLCHARQREKVVFLSFSCCSAMLAELRAR